MRDIVEKNVELLYFKFLQVRAFYQALQHLFAHLPLFLPKNTMVHVTRAKRRLQRAISIYQQGGRLLDAAATSQGEFSELNEACIITATKLTNSFGKLQKVLARTLEKMRSSILPHQEIIIARAEELQELFQQAAVEGSRLVAHIEASGPPSAVTRANFEALLNRAVVEVKTLWELLHTLLPDQSSVTTQRYLGYQPLLNKIGKKNSLVGGGKWLDLQQQPQLVVSLLSSACEAETIPTLLQQLYLVMKNYVNYLFTRNVTKLRRVFTAYYEQALRLQEDIVFARTWLRLLEAKSIHILALEDRGVAFALQAKHLIYTLKKQLYREFYQQSKQHTATIMTELLQQLPRNEEINAETVFRKMWTIQENLAQRISAVVMQLHEYSWYINLITGGIRIYSESYYFQWPKMYFTAADEQTHALMRNTPILGVKLSDSYINGFSAVMGGAVFSADLYSSKWFGTSYTMMTTLSRLLLTDYDTLISLTDRLAIQRTTAVTNIPNLEWVLALCLNIGCYSLKYGVRLGTIGYFGTNFVVASACRWLAGYLLDKVSGQPGTRLHHFLAGIVRHLGFAGGGYATHKAYSAFAPFFQSAPPGSQLLHDRKLCLEHQQVCRQEALRVLDLPSNATGIDIRNRYRFLSLRAHPDREGGDAEKYMGIASAKERLTDLDTVQRLTTDDCTEDSP